MRQETEGDGWRERKEMMRKDEDRREEIKGGGGEKRVMKIMET